MNQIAKTLIRASVLALSSGVMLMPTVALAAVPPTQVNQCSDTFIQRVGARLMDGQTRFVEAAASAKVEFRSNSDRQTVRFPS